MLLQMELYANELKKHTQVNVFLPNDKEKTAAPCKTLWLLHGGSDDHTAWTRNTFIEQYAAKYDLAVVMPNADRSWYTNTAYDMNYFNYIVDELPTLCRRTFKMMSDRREDNIIGGLSMGGYGALKAALTFPERYASCISLSGSVDVTRKGRRVRINEWKSVFGFDLESPLELEGSEHDIFALASKVKEAGKSFPKVYLWCGLGDALLNANCALGQHLTELGAPHCLETSEGDHSWKWWDLHIQSGLKWVLDDQR